MIANVADLISSIEKGKGAKFASFLYRSKGTGELARHTIILGASTETLYQKDIEVLQFLMDAGEFDGIRLEAAAAILKSRHESLTVGVGHNSAYTHSPENGDTYVYPVGLPGIRVHKETGEVYVNGLTEGKVVIEAGEYKVVKSRPLTLAKKEIEKMIPGSRFRQFILRNVRTAKLNGEVLEIEMAD
jgi:hypothetical protein